MWSVECISGLIFVVNISAGMHWGNEPLRHQDRVQLQAQEIEPEFTHHHIQEIEKVGSVIFTEHIPYNSKE